LFNEDAVAFKVDDLFGLRDREGNRGIPVLMGFRRMNRCTFTPSAASFSMIPAVW
jgi:hypothetical protein